MSQINIRNLSNENDDGSPEIVGVSTFSATSFFVPPKGSTAERPSDCEPGTLRFNTDIGTLEVFRGKTIGWESIQRRDSQYLGGGTGSNTGTGTRGIFGSGEAPHGNTIDFLTISTFGDSTDFGNLTQDRRSGGAMGSSETRGLFAGGQHPSPFTFFNIIDFVTIASTGNASNFGDLSRQVRSHGGAESTTRGVFFGGTFPAVHDEIDFVTFSTTGNATDFGDLTDERDNVKGSSSSTRGVMAGGRDPSNTNIIDFITIASAGNALDFGDLLSAKFYYAATGNKTRAVWAGDNSLTNAMEFVTIATTGNAVDFGDQNGTAQQYNGCASDSHGGL